MTEQQFASLLAEVRAIRHALERRPRSPEDDPASIELMRVIHRAVGARLFTSADLIEHAGLPTHGALRAAVLGVVRSVGARSLAKALRKLEGQDLGGLRLERDRVERDGIMWRIVAVSAVSNTADPVAVARVSRRSSRL